MAKNSTSVEQITAGISFGKASGSIIEVVKSEAEPDAINPHATTQLPYAKWGRDNKFPQRHIDEVKKDVVSIGAIEFKVAAHYGLGPYLYRQHVDPVKKKIIIEPVLLETLPDEIQEFWYINDIENFCQQNIVNYEWFRHHYVQYIVNKSANKILQVKNQRTKDVRVGKRDHATGVIKSYWLSPYFGTSHENGNRVEVPAFDKFNPLSVPNGIYQHNVPSIDRDYYPDASHQSTGSWLRLATKIPIWIISNIDNSVNIKYHVEIPEKYFLDVIPRKNYGSDQEHLSAMKTHEEELKAKIDECLAGAENPMKIFYTKFAVDHDGKQMPGWKFNVLPNDLKDGAWLNAYATAAVATLSGHGVSATVTNLSLPSSLNVGSGSDTREKFNFHMQLCTVIPRQTTTEWWEIVKRSNNWDRSLKLGYQNVILETLDNNPTGTRGENENKPTSPEKNAIV